MVILIVHNFDFRREIQGAFSEVLCWFKQNLFYISYIYITRIFLLFKALSCDGLTWCLTSIETTRLIMDGEMEGKGV